MITILKFPLKLISFSVTSETMTFNIWDKFEDSLIHKAIYETIINSIHFYCYYFTYNFFTYFIKTKGENSRD